MRLGACALAALLVLVSHTVFLVVMGFFGKVEIRIDPRIGFANKTAVRSLNSPPLLTRGNPPKKTLVEMFKKPLDQGRLDRGNLFCTCTTCTSASCLRLASSGRMRVREREGRNEAGRRSCGKRRWPST